MSNLAGIVQFTGLSIYLMYIHYSIVYKQKHVCELNLEFINSSIYDAWLPKSKENCL